MQLLSMKRAYKLTAVAVALIAALSLTAVFYFTPRLAAIGAAYKAKILCSGVFVSERDPQSVLDTDLSGDDLAALRFVDTHTDRNLHTVTADFFGLVRRTAVFQEGRGCTVVYENVEQPSARSARISGDGVQPKQGSEPDTGKESPPQLNMARLNAALDWAFTERDPAIPRNTRAVVVVYDGHLVAERYADGFTKHTALMGWSMTKSVINALVGILVQEGKISLRDPVPIAAWKSPDDPRRTITWEQLLRMNSGLEFDEDYRNPLADVTYMLFGVPDAAAYAIAKPLVAEPGSHWSYSSGTTNIISSALRQIVGDPDYPEFPRRALFDRLGMTNAVMESDASGTFVGSSFMYATASDWARFGLLYLRDGVWSGQRILPEGWVAYTRTPTSNAPDQKYGAHFWLRVPKEFHCGGGEDMLPPDAFHAIGYEGQFVTIIPSRKLVLVRLGLTRRPCVWDHPEFVRLVLAAIPNGTSNNAASSTGARPLAIR